MSPYTLRCTLCAKTFNGRGKWLRHLTSGRHQTRARLDCANWGKEERKCVLVAFSSVAIDSQKADHILQTFGRGDMGGLVTDFVTFPERPRVGLMQFESREKVVEILKGLERTGRAAEVSLDGFHLHFRKAKSYFDFEWTELILAGAAVLPPPSAEFNLEATSSTLARAELGPTKTEPDPEPSVSPELSSYHCETMEAQAKEDPSPPPESRNLSASEYPFSTKSDLQRQFRKLCEIVEIPPVEYSQALEIVSDIQRVLGPDHLVFMYRYWYLGLRSPGDDLLSLFTSKRRNISPSVTFPSTAFLGPSMLRGRLQTTNLFPGFDVKIKGTSQYRMNSKHLLFFNSATKVRFAVTSFSSVLVETQLCSLAQYMCTFDPRVKPLLTLVFAWAMANRVEFGKEPCDWHHEYSLFNPEPASMVWLVLHFLVFRGILPSPREIQRRPHKPMVYRETQEGTVYDLGFEPDPEFAEEWRRRSDFQGDDVDALSVLMLAKDWFQHLSRTWASGSWIFNTRDGEIYEKTEFGNDQSTGRMSLTPTEAHFLRRKVRARGSKGHGCLVYIMHPFNLNCRLAFNSDEFVAIREKLKTTAENLRSMLASEGEADIKLEKVLSVDGRKGEWSKRRQCDTSYGFWKEKKKK